MPPNDPIKSTSGVALLPGEVETIVEHMLNGMAYCKMLFEDGQPCDFIYLYTNPAFESLTGLSGVIGKRVTDVISGIRETDPLLLEIYGRVARGGKPEKFEIHVESLGTWFSITVYSPKPEHFVALFDVITERKQAERDLLLANERLSLAQRTAGAGVWDWDILNGTLTWSDEFFRLFGLDPATAAASFDTWRSVLHPDDLQRAEERIMTSIRDHSPSSTNTESFCRPGRCAGSMRSVTLPMMRTATHSA